MPLADWDDNVIDLIVGVATPIISTTGLVIIGWWQHGKLKRIERHAAATKEQVVNSHSSNMRDDLDKVLAVQERIEEKQDKFATHIEKVEAKSELAMLHAQVEHSKLWNAITGGDPPMPKTSEIEIQRAQERTDP